MVPPTPYYCDYNRYSTYRCRGIILFLSHVHVVYKFCRKEKHLKQIDDLYGDTETDSAKVRSKGSGRQCRKSDMK